MIIHYETNGTVTFDPPLRKYRSLKLIDRATGEVHDRATPHQPRRRDG